MAVDENVGKVFDALKEKGVLDDTALFYTSDNGFFAGEWQAFDKRFMHEPSIRVPMLVRYPKAAMAGTLCDRMVLNVDIAPTLLDAAGLAVPKEVHGRRMVPLLKDPKHALETRKSRRMPRSLARQRANEVDRRDHPDGNAVVIDDNEVMQAAPRDELCALRRSQSVVNKFLPRIRDAACALQTFEESRRGHF